VDQLLATKLYTPQLDVDFVVRKRLYDFLEDGMTRKVVLVCAPAGFGKSTLVSGWLSETGRSAAWLSLDQGDNDPVRFWSYFIAAIQTVSPEMGIEAQKMLRTPQLRSAEPVAVSLVNDIAAVYHDIAVVLDDFHLIEDREIHSVLSYVLDHQPSNLHIFLLTRADPQFAMARLRAHNALIEVRAGDLQFSPDEAATLLNDKMGLALDPWQIDTVTARTENWAVGLRLAAVALRDHPAPGNFLQDFTGSHHFILDYLAEEVIRNLPAEQREFLLRTSLLERFCGELCQEVAGVSSGQAMLEEIRKRNLFLIRLDGEGNWFRYHHLFAEVLHALLRHHHSGEIGALHLKAAEWLDGNGYPVEAVDHGLRSGNTARAADLVLRHWLPAVHRGEVATVLRWLDALPHEVTAGDLPLTLARCWALLVSGQTAAIAPHLEQADRQFDAAAKDRLVTDTDTASISAQLSMMRSVVARSAGDHAQAVAYAEAAGRLVPGDRAEGIGTTWTIIGAARAGAGDYEGAIEAYGRGIEPGYADGNLSGAFGCIYGQAMYLVLQGRIGEADALCRAALERADRESNGELPAAGWLHIAMARIALERTHLDTALTYVDHGLRIATTGGFGEAVRSGRCVQAHILAARGEFDSATRLFEETERIVRSMRDPYLAGDLSREWAGLCFTRGDLEGAHERMRVLEESIASTKHANLVLARRWMVPRLLCAEERYEAAVDALDDSIRHARRAKSNGELLRLLALLAAAHGAVGDRQAAGSDLIEALELGAAGGYVWRVMDAGPLLGDVLLDIGSDRQAGRFRDYLDLLVRAHREIYSTGRIRQAARDSLTRREVEIMRLICRGLSNQEIAGELIVSLNTVKKHTSNIYGKLGVRSRTQAIARARGMDLV
jgi:LuxR family maltose regulon positive regulatory protein